MAKSRVNTELQGKIITSDELYMKAKAWADMVRAIAKNNANAFNKGKKRMLTYPKTTNWHESGENEHKLINSLKFKIYEKDGITNDIGFRFQRHGIFRMYGVGAGQSINGKQAKKVYVHRSISDWLDKPIDDNFEKLADIVAEFYGDKAVINPFNMRINKPVSLSKYKDKIKKKLKKEGKK